MGEINHLYFYEEIIYYYDNDGNLFATFYNSNDPTTVDIDCNLMYALFKKELA